MIPRDPLVWLAYGSILVQGAFALALYFFGSKLSQWTRASEAERRSSDRQVRSNQTLIDYLARATHSSPLPLPQDEEVA